MDKRKIKQTYTGQKLFFYFDENFPKKIINELKSDKGFSKKFGIRSAIDINKGKDDRQHFQYCKKLGYMLVTLDDDFVNDRKYPFGKLPGIIVLSFSKNSIGKIKIALSRIAYFLSFFPFPRIFAGDSKFQVSLTRCIMRGRDVKTRDVKTYVIKPRDTVYEVGKKFGYF
ncbi:DUF5615 family PIN-like protein [Patescibacteria group bacterium]|nr:DUF5615 family PIN-like protein [Patescibacteria group bacterium]